MLLDDRAVTSCMVMAGQVQGRRVVTIEGLTGHDGALSPLQQAFVDHFAVQCGRCTGYDAIVDAIDAAAAEMARLV